MQENISVNEDVNINNQDLEEKFVSENNIIEEEQDDNIIACGDEIIELVAEYSHEDAILIGGNGQDVIIDIQERIKLISEKLS